MAQAWEVILCHWVPVLVLVLPARVELDALMLVDAVVGLLLVVLLIPVGLKTAQLDALVVL